VIAPNISGRLVNSFEARSRISRLVRPSSVEGRESSWFDDTLSIVKAAKLPKLVGNSASRLFSIRNVFKAFKVLILSVIVSNALSAITSVVSLVRDEIVDGILLILPLISRYCKFTASAVPVGKSVHSRQVNVVNVVKRLKTALQLLPLHSLVPQAPFDVHGSAP